MYAIELHQNSSTAIYDSEIISSFGHCWLAAYDSSLVTSRNSTILGIGCHDSSHFSIFSSDLKYLTDYGPNTDVSVYNSVIYQIDTYSSAVLSLVRSTISLVYAHEFSQLRISDSAIDEIYTYEESAAWLISSTYANCGTYDQSKIFVCWYLDVHVVDSRDQKVPSANITATPPNATMAGSKLTDDNGWARLTLTEKMLNVTGDYPIGNYTIEALYNVYSNGTAVNMTKNQEITIALEDLVVPEFPSILMLSLFIVATLLIAVIYKRRHDTVSEFFHK